MVSFLGRQVRIATEGFGEMDPLDLDEYISQHGFVALGKVLGSQPETTIAAITASGLRGRGGAGFPTGVKWSRMRAAAAADGIKYVIVNGDEGDPGAFMDRMLMESFPFRVLEGMMIAAASVGATEGYLYVRAEYPARRQPFARGDPVAGSAWLSWGKSDGQLLPVSHARF